MLSFSVWVNGRPVEEFSAAFCIAPDENAARQQCTASPAIAYTLKGVDSLRLAVSGGPTPDAALHFVEIRGRLQGVLWRKANATEGFLTWQLEEHSGEKLEQYLAKAVMPAFAAATNEAALRSVGRGLYNVLFPTDASAARQAFEAFVQSYPRLMAAPAAGFVAPSIYVRVVAPSLSSELMVPIGLMWVNDAFVGFSFRVELPLPAQSYRAASACVSRWVMALPPENSDKPLTDALAVFANRIEGAQGWKERGAAVHRRMEDVRAWLADGKTDQEPLAFFVTSHHHQDRIYFKEAESIFSAEIEHRFARPSIAVLNGCGTGGPGATDFVEELNKRGVAAVIATSTEVTGHMAGRFLVCLTNAVDATATAGDTPLSQAYLAALHCLRAEAPQGGTPYGGRALAYLLLGDGNLWLCSPRRTS
jgi:hypothetical protein